MAVSMQNLLYSEGTLETQLVLLVIWAVLWYVTLQTCATRLFQPFIRSKPWCQQWTDMSRNMFRSALFTEFKTEKETFEFATLFLAILCQHGLGGALCVPSMLGYAGPIISAMVKHGAMCEAGWELQDACLRAYQLLFGGEAGRAKNPQALVFLSAVHHAMGLSMVIPMNMVYGDNPYYHEFVFLLQGAAFIAMMSQNYGYTLNVKTASGLLQMKASVALTVATMLWSRVFRYLCIGYHLMRIFINDGNMAFAYVGGVALGLMGILNCLLVADAMNKFMKFMKMEHADERCTSAQCKPTPQPAELGSVLLSSDDHELRARNLHYLIETTNVRMET